MLDVPPTRQEVEERLGELRHELAAIEGYLHLARQSRAGIGHNRPPEPIAGEPSDEDLAAAEESVREIRQELDRPDAADTGDLPTIERATGRFKKLLALLSVGVGAVAWEVGKGVLNAAGEDLYKDPHLVAAKLHTVVDTLQTWAHYLQSVL